ncbi:hypothetical protein INR49_020259 [Caranx melampygus]|nr:hypothetical protein INR49_020259 [Caranx melampygus]
MEEGGGVEGLLCQAEGKDAGMVRLMHAGVSGVDSEESARLSGFCQRDCRPYSSSPTQTTSSARTRRGP